MDLNHSPAATHLSRRRLPITVLALALVALGWASLLGTTPARAAEPPAPAATKPRVKLGQQTPWVGPTDSFAISLRLTDAPPDASLSFRVYGDSSSRGRIHYLKTMRGDELDAPIHAPYVLPVANITAADGTVSATFEIAPDHQPFVGYRLDREGVYPMVVTLQSGGRDLDSFVTPIIRLPQAAGNGNPALDLSVIAPIDAPVALRTDGSSDLDPTIAAGLTDTVDALAEHKDVPLTVAPSPETVVALSERDGRTGADVTSRLASSLNGRQVLGAPYVKLDVGAWVNDGMEDALLGQLNEGNDTLASLLDTRPDRRTWIVDDTVTPAAMAKLRQAGVDQVVVPENQLTPLDARAFPVALTRSFELDTPGARTRAVQADGILRAHLSVSDDQVLNANRLLGDLAILYFDQPQLKRGAVLSLPDNGITPKEFLTTLLGALATTAPAESGGKGIISAATLDSLFTFVEPAGQNGGRGASEGVARPEPTLVRGWTSAPPATMGNYRTQLSLAHNSLGSYQSMVPADPSRVVPLDVRLTVSGAAQFTGTQRQGYLDAAVEFVDNQANGVDVPEQQQVTLTSTEGQVPLVLENRLSYPVDVRVRMSGDKVDFVDQADFTTTLQPGSNRVDVKLVSKASGAYPINVAVSSPDGQLPMSTGRLPIRSTAISGLGLALTIGAGVFLALWWARNFRNARRHRRLISADNHPTATSEPATVTASSPPAAPGPASSSAAETQA